MPDLVHNETIKLAANWLHAASVAVVAGGVIVPVASYVYGTTPQMPVPDWGLFLICVGFGLFLHLTGQALLGGLDNGE